MLRKYGEDCTCSSTDMLADRHAETHTDLFIKKSAPLAAAE